MADLACNQEVRISGATRDQRANDGMPGVVTEEILPHLMRSHGIPDRDSARSHTSTVSKADVDYFCTLVAASESTRIAHAITALHARGVPADDMMLDLLPAVARMFGQRWVSDESDFTSVTIALGHLQQMRRDIGGLPRQNLMPSGPPRRALLAPAPGEQHNFGIMIVDHFLHQAGWDVRTLPQSSCDEIVNLAARDSYEIVGLSISCEAYLLSLERTIATLRRASKNRTVAIMVGGRLFLEKPGLALLIGADAAATDGRDAVRQAERLTSEARRLLTMD